MHTSDFEITGQADQHSEKQSKTRQPYIVPVLTPLLNVNSETESNIGAGHDGSGAGHSHS